MKIKIKIKDKRNGHKVRIILDKDKSNISFIPNKKEISENTLLKNLVIKQLISLGFPSERINTIFN